MVAQVISVNHPLFKASPTQRNIHVFSSGQERPFGPGGRSNTDSVRGPRQPFTGASAISGSQNNASLDEISTLQSVVAEVSATIQLSKDVPTVTCCRIVDQSEAAQHSKDRASSLSRGSMGALTGALISGAWPTMRGRAPRLPTPKACKWPCSTRACFASLQRTQQSLRGPYNPQISCKAFLGTDAYNGRRSQRRRQDESRAIKQG